MTGAFIPAITPTEDHTGTQNLAGYLCIMHYRYGYSMLTLGIERAALSILLSSSLYVDCVRLVPRWH
jgi:hypothetical protein